MQFDFIAMQNLYLSLARQDARPLVRALKRRPVTARESQWATFVRNHDELTLDKLTDKQREEVFAAFGPDPDMQLYGRGLRRRLPPMLDGDPRRLRFVYSLLFSLPGTPVLFYGEEIGMGENLDIPGRLAVRTPMQWSDDRNGGFSDAAPSRLRRPVTEGGYGPEHVNVADQRTDPGSLLSFLRLLIRRYRESPELGWSPFAPLDQPHPDVLAHLCARDERRLLAVHNFSSEGRPVTVTAGRLSRGHRARRPARGRLVDAGGTAGPRRPDAGRLRLPVVAHPREGRPTAALSRRDRHSAPPPAAVVQPSGSVRPAGHRGQ